MVSSALQISATSTETLVQQAAATLAPAPSFQFAIPLADIGDLQRLSEKRRVEVQVALKLLERVHALRSEGRALEAAAATVAAVARAQVRGASGVSLLRKYSAYIKSGGDWRALVKNYRGPKKTPVEFDDFIKQLAEENHRSMSAAWEHLRDVIWPGGMPVPGYGTWMECWMREHPARALPSVYPRGWFPKGWSRRNLYNKAPGKGARLLYQRGMMAAKKHFPSIRRDPSQLRPLELIVIDDFELDCLCVFPGDAKNKPQIGRVAGLLAMDVATRRILHWCIGQRLEREERQPDGTVRTVRTGIARIDVQVFLHGLFRKTGLPDHPATILCENATASISPDMELALTTLFEGRVRVERTGFLDHKTLANGFVERGGKPWEKGWIESLFNQLWNILGAMPGYKGSNQRLNGPANLDAKINYTKMFIGWGEKARDLNLPPEKIALGRLPFPSPQAAERTFAWACALRDARTEHKFIGFERITEYVLRDGEAPQPFHALALLPESEQLLAQPVERMESPLERWGRLAGAVAFRAIPDDVLALLLLTPKRVTYRNEAITFTLSSGKKSDGHTYIDADGAVFAGVQEGTEFLAYYDAAIPERLTLTRMDGSFAGTLTRLGGRRGLVPIGDKAAMDEAAALQARIVNRVRAAVRARHAGEDAQLALDRAHNKEIKEAHKAETAELTKAGQIAAAVGVIAGAAAEARERADALAGAGELDATKLF
jgi:hypothetical protein